MRDWVNWPHIHGSPVFARFQDGSAFMYVWPEKDHLKAFACIGDRFDVQNRKLGVDENGKLMLAPLLTVPTSAFERLSPVFMRLGERLSKENNSLLNPSSETQASAAKSFENRS
jgi:hypothetical protein